MAPSRYHAAPGKATAEVQKTGAHMLAVNLSRAELELLVNAVEIAGQTGWPSGDDRLRVQVLRKQLEKAIADLQAQGWQGGR